MPFLCTKASLVKSRIPINRNTNMAGLTTKVFKLLSAVCVKAITFCNIKYKWKHDDEFQFVVCNDHVCCYLKFEYFTLLIVTVLKTRRTWLPDIADIYGYYQHFLLTMLGRQFTSVRTSQNRWLPWLDKCNPIKTKWSVISQVVFFKQSISNFAKC